MALLALPGCPFVDHGGTYPDHAALVMAQLARNPVMRAIEFEGGMKAVIEFSGLPAQNGVAAVATFFVRTGFVGARPELAAVDVGMAARAVFRRAMERYAADGFLCHRLVACKTIDSPMPPQQRECCLAVVEAATLFPGDHQMARLAVRRRRRLPVRILVAIGAPGRGRVIGRVICARGNARGMAAGAGHRNMGALKSESRLVMGRHCVVRRRPARRIVAILAPVVVPRRELTLVCILMALGADCKRNPVGSLLAFGYVALRALRFCVFRQQRISRLRVIVDGEDCRLPAALGVTRFAVTPVGPARELSSVLILVAVQTARKRHRRLEILGLMAIPAGCCRVFAEQRIIRPVVIEPVVRKQLLPAACRVATRAVSAKSAAVDILMAGSAEAERNRGLELHEAVRRRCCRPVTQCAVHPGV